MIAGISSWAKGIIVAVIIGIIIQMILPEGKNKKYIKIIIGVYTLFCIINPVIGKNINLEDYGIEKYLNVEIAEEKEKTSEYDANVIEIFKKKVIENISSELEAKGYKSDNIELQVDKDCNIKKIKISNIYELKENKQEEDTNSKNSKENEKNNKTNGENKIETNVENVQKVEIGIKDTPVKGIAESDKQTLIDYLSENYKIDKKLITIE